MPNRKTRLNGAQASQGILVEAPRIVADRASARDCACTRPAAWGGVCDGLPRRTGAGRGDLHPGKGLRALAAQARRGCPIGGRDRGLHRRDPLRTAGRRQHRPSGGFGPRLRCLRAPRSRRHRHPPVAGTPRHHQHHVGGRAHLRRFPSRRLGRAAAEPAHRGGARACRAGARGRARPAPAAR